MSYRKYMEQQLGRRLESHEHVHHKDGNHFNNDPSNLQHCPTPKDHAREHAWGDDELIDWLIQFADEFGRFPTKVDCDLHPGMPHSSTFRRRFGSWGEALRRASLKNDIINYDGSYDHDQFE